MRKIFSIKYNVNFFSTFFVILAVLFSSTNLAHASKIGVPPNFIPGNGLSNGLVGYWTFDGKDTTIPGPVVTYITSGSTWAVPSDWNSSNNTIEVIGGGGGGNGSNTAGGGNGGTAGSGGAYAKVVNLSLTPSSSVDIGVGTGGAGGARDTKGGAGGDTWFNATSLANAVTNGSSVSVAAAGAAQSALLYSTAGTAGQASASVGTTKYSGGTGGAANIFQAFGGGGGGGAGPNGDGGAGGTATGSQGAGGGGSGGGAAGSSGSGNNGGNGGANYTASKAGGTGGANDGAPGTGDSNGASGAAGGGYGVFGSQTANGGVGGSGQEWDSTHGSGGGGGGAGRGNAGNADGGNAGSYGAGGGGGSDSASDGVGGNGSQGLIVVTYTPATAATVDKSGNGNTGTPTNMSQATSPVSGKIGQGLSFDGTNDYVSAGDVSSSVKTVSFWMKTTNITKKIIDLNGTATIETSSGTITANSFTSPTIYVNGAVSSTITADKWYHVTITTDTAINASAVDIGRISTGYFPGVLDEVRIYSRALSATEIGQLYNLGAAKFGISPTKSITSGLVGYWTFDGKDTPWTSSTAATTVDKSGNGNTGTPTNMSQATSPVSGKIGQGLSFDGTNDYVSAGDVSSSVKTVSFWMKTTNITKKIIDLNGTATIETSSGTITANSFTSPTIYVNGAVSSTITADKWYHVTITTDTAINASAVDIGRISTGYFPGVLDEVRIYSRALSTTEIQQLYNIGR